MGATNHTANYNLSQYVGTDKPAWLQDYNGDMTKIDAGINAAKLAADSAALDAGAAQSDATAANNAITNTITPAISSLQNTVGTQGGAINTINSLIGNGTPTTTDQTIIGAINEINGKVPDYIFEYSYNSVQLADSQGTNLYTHDFVIDISSLGLSQAPSKILPFVNSNPAAGLFAVKAITSTECTVVLWKWSSDTVSGKIELEIFV